MNKQEKLTNAVKTFKKSEQSTDDYIVLFQAVQNLLRQGSGLMWDQIKDCIDSTSTKNWEVALVESERGWGSKIDEYKYFETEKQANEFVKEFNSKNDKDYVPDWFMYAKYPIPYYE